MKAQRNICVDSLTKKEAWILFKRVVGEKVEIDAKLKRIAKKVAEQCGGLPLIIEVVGNALKDIENDRWEIALNLLKNHASHDIDSEIKKAIFHLKLSYYLLGDDEVRLCFLLCSMFPEDASIPLERLAQYVMALGKFKGLDSIEDARERVQAKVDTLKSSSLLLNGTSQFSTKMHNVVRDVALLIASEGENKFLVKAGKGLTRWQPRENDSESYVGISLMRNNICKLPNRKLRVPSPHILLIQENPALSTISNEFIQSLEKAKVLDMEHNNISSLPSSLKLLTELRMLNLAGNRSLHEISKLGELINLEILILNVTGIKQIPQEIGQLVNLRRLEVRGCYNLDHIAPGVISKLFSLEELNIGFYSKLNHNSLIELSKLSYLRILDLFVPVFDLIPEDVQYVTLKKYVIQIGGDEISFDIPQEFNSGHHLILETPDLPSSIPLKNLIECDDVSCLVDNSDEMQTILSSIEHGGRKRRKKLFSKMESVILRGMKNLEVLWKCPHQCISFCNLESIFLSLCPKLARVFPVSVAKGLISLRSIALSCCEHLEVVVWAKDEEPSNSEIEMEVQDANIVFRNLTTINLDRLPKLKSFYSGHSTIKYPSLEMITVFGCSSPKIWGSGLHEIPKMNFHYQGTAYNINEIMAICSEKNEPMTFDDKVNE